MSDDELLNRFEELEAGRILGDLDAEETKEWQDLSEKLGSGPDFSLELAAAAIETEFAGDLEEPLPDHMAKRLHREIAAFAAPGTSDEKIIHPPIWNRILSSPQAAWAVAALFAVLFVANFLARNTDPAPPVVDNPPKLSPEGSRDRLIGSARDLIESDFGGTEAYNQMSGSVVWSDVRQEGYMTLTNLPANNPTTKQYQLWIVDPDRDEKPVDGGVFDIPAGSDTAVIPIRNPLGVSNPAAFVITLEQPGGVVVSKQDIVVALAKVS